MPFLIKKIPLILEILINGTFILLCTLTRYNYLADYFTPSEVQGLLNLLRMSCPWVIAFSLLFHLSQLRSFEKLLRKHHFGLVVIFPLFVSINDLEFIYWLCCAHLIHTILISYESDSSVQAKKTFETKVKSIYLQPSQMVLLAFIGMIFAGTLLLMLPIASSSGKGVNFIDALFLATSAACVTGLQPLSIADDLSFFGQVVIMILVQVGGLGIMILYSSMTLLLGKSMALRERIVMLDILDAANFEELMGVIIDIIKYTFIIELWGSIVLSMAFLMEGIEFSRALYYGVFHAVTAFCNCGFALFSNNLENFGTTPGVHFTVAVLVILGGLGFTVLRDMKFYFFSQDPTFRLSTHSKIVLLTTVALLISGTLIIFFGEFLNALDGHSLWEKVQLAFFQSVTLRTAGFNTLPMSGLHFHTLFIMTMFMFIGGSPGSTAGGIKTTTFAILIQSIKSTLKGRDRVEIFERTIPNLIVVKTTALTMISIIITTLFVFILVKLEAEQSFLSLIFEVISAFGTVGLSMGLTPYLSPLGKLAITIVMFIGRVGPLTLVLAIGQKGRQEGRFEYPVGRVMIG